MSSSLVALAPEDITSAFSSLLQEVGTALDCDRASLLTFDEDETSIDISFTWQRDGAPAPEPDRDMGRLPWVTQQLLQGRPLVLNRLPDSFPDDASAERKWLRAFPAKSALLLPVVVAGRRTAVIVVVSCRRFVDFPEAVIDELRLAGEIFALALHRLRQSRALRESRARAERLAATMKQQGAFFDAEVRSAKGFDDIVATGAAMADVLTRVSEVAPTDATVLILGETGTGKELIARSIHDRSIRSGGPFIRVNCAALPPTLIESELFGHERGAFTGALTARQGRFELADRGTIFLDEVGDIPLELQAKLLRVLQEREFERLGSATPRKVNVRVVAATNRDLHEMVQAGRFRSDLYYRLNVFPIQLPPLRERREDIPKLVWFFIHQRQRSLRRHITQIPAAVMAALQEYSWPGNVRELQNVIERAMIRSKEDVLRLDDSLTAVVPAPAASDRVDGPETLEKVERAHIINVLDSAGWRINGPGNAAERLKLHPNTLRFRMKRLGIERPQRRPS